LSLVSKKAEKRSAKEFGNLFSKVSKRQKGLVDFNEALFVWEIEDSIEGTIEGTILKITKTSEFFCNIESESAKIKKTVF
jgi:hypothetical protein